MKWYWLFVRYHHGVDTTQHRFQANDDDDALSKALEWCKDKIGIYSELSVAKEIFH